MTVNCPYCGDKYDNPSVADITKTMYGFTSGHHPCKYEWEVDEWCSVCDKPVCICIPRKLTTTERAHKETANDPPNEEI